MCGRRRRRGGAPLRHVCGMHVLRQVREPHSGENRHGRNQLETERLEWRSERLVLEGRRKGGCSAPHAVDPVSIPHGTEEQGVTTGTNRELNPQVNGPLPRPPQVRDRTGSTSQGGDTGSNPVGTTQVRGRIRTSRERVAPHWPRGAHEAVTTRCSVTRPKRMGVVGEDLQSNIPLVRRSPIADRGGTPWWSDGTPRKPSSSSLACRRRVDRRLYV
jgi:hypothetical protein